VPFYVCFFFLFFFIFFFIGSSPVTRLSKQVKLWV